MSKTSIPRSMQQVMRVPVDRDAIAEVVRVVQEEHESTGADAGYHAHAFAAIRLYSNRGSDTCVAIMERLKCMIEMLSDERAKGWSRDSAEKGVMMMHPAFLYASAITPMLADGDKFRFDPDVFFENALKNTEDAEQV